MAKSVDQAWSEIGAGETKKKKEKETETLATKIGRLFGILTVRSFVTGVCLLGVQWMLAEMMPSLTAIQQLIPLWVATLGGLALNTLVGILAATTRDYSTRVPTAQD